MTPSHLSLSRHLRRRLVPASVAIALLISVAMPATYYVLQVAALRQAATLHAEEVSDALRGILVESPIPWKYQTKPFHEALFTFSARRRTVLIRIADESGRTVAEHAGETRESGAWWNPGTVAGSAPLVFNDRRLGSVHVELGLGSLIQVTAGLFLTSSVLGLTLGAFVMAFPVAVVRRSEARISDLVEEIQRSNAGLERRAVELGALLRATRAVRAVQDVEAILDAILVEAAKIAGTEHVKILLVDRAAGVLRVSAWRGSPVPPGFTVPVGKSYSGTIAVTGEPIFVGDTQNDPNNLLAERDRQLGICTFLGLPVKAGNEVLGVLSLNTYEPKQYSADELACLGSFADQAAIAIENANLYSALRTRVQRLRALTRLNRLISSTLEVGEVLREINLAAAELMDAPVASFWLADEAEQTLDAIAFSDPVAGADYPVRKLSFGEGAVGWAALHRQTVNVADVYTDGRLVNLDWWRRHGLTSFVAIPVIFEGSLLAVLALNGRTPFHLDADDEDLLDGFVAQIAVAIRNARLFAGTEARRREAEALAEIGRVLSQTLDPDVVARRIVETVTALLRARSAAVFRVDPATLDLVSVAVAGEVEPNVRLGTVFPRGTGAVGRAVTEGRPVTTANLLTDPDVILSAEQHGGVDRSHYRAVLAVPLTVQGTVIGALGVADREAREFDPGEIQLAQSFADQAALALESARLYRESQRTLAELEAKNAELDSFVYSVSHDLKAPLVAAQGMAGALLEDCADRLDEQGRHYLARLQANVHGMEGLIQNLLALSRVGRESQAPGAVSLAELVSEVLGELAGPIRERGIKVTVGDLGTVRAMPAQIQQVLSNLIGNAVKYIGDPKTPTIEIGSAAQGAMVECWVRDNGIGIDPAYHSKVFEIFQRLHDVEAEGTGVGLAIVKKAVEAAGGRIWLESAPGRGSTFRFTWPTAEGRERHEAR